MPVTVSSQREFREWGPEQVHPLPLGASGGEPSPQSGPDLAALPPRTLELSGPNAASVWQMATDPVPDPIGSSRHDSFSGEPDPEPIPQLTLSCAWPVLPPSYLWLSREAGLRLSFLLASSSITCSWTMGTTDVALPIGSLLDESPPSEVIH